MIHVGTSGYNYPEWRGTFYPEEFPAKEMFGVLRGALRHRRDQLHVLPDADAEDDGGVARRRRPTDSATRSRRRAASRTTSGSRTVADSTQFFCDAARVLGTASRAAAVPAAAEPQVRRAATATRFSTRVPRDLRPASSSATTRGMTDEVYALLRKHGVALCIADFGDHDDAAPGHRAARLLPPPRRRLPASPISRDGRRRSRNARRLGRCVRVLQARGRRKGPRVRAGSSSASCTGEA